MTSEQSAIQCSQTSKVQSAITWLSKLEGLKPNFPASEGGKTFSFKNYVGAEYGPDTNQ
jgi:hypothetical protein